LLHLARISHELFDLKLNYLTLLINGVLFELQGVFRFKSKSSPFGTIDFSAKSALQTTRRFTAAVVYYSSVACVSTCEKLY
jgi:hypothetical protein